VRAVVPIVFAMALLAPAPALAAPAIEVHLAAESVRYGTAHDVTGTLTDGAAPLAGQQVVLEGLRYPFRGSYRVIAKAQTDAKGAFEFKPVLDRNHRLRVVASAQQTVSQILHAYTLPSSELSYKQLKSGAVRLTQLYTVPKPVKLSAPTLFYLGRAHAGVASKRVSGVTERVRAGHYSSTVDVTLPPAWKGEFRFGSCFHTSAGSGMGDPGAGCAKLHFRF
jgi:hypothetical protein